VAPRVINVLVKEATEPKGKKKENNDDVYNFIKINKLINMNIIYFFLKKIWNCHDIVKR